MSEKTMALGVLAAVFLFASCGCAKDVPSWPSTPTKVDLRPYPGVGLLGIEFSSDDEMISVGWYGSKGLSINAPLRVAFNTDGTPVRGIFDGTGRLTMSHAKAFPKILPRTTQGLYHPLIDLLKEKNPFATWLRDAGGWAFNEDLTLGLRLVDPRSGFDGSKLPWPPGGFIVWRAELWRLAPTEKRLWSVDLPRQTGVLGPVEFFARDGRDYVFLAFGGSSIYILSQDDGRMTSLVGYDGIEGVVEPSGDEQLRSGPRPRSSLADVAEVAFQPRRGLLAFGSSTGKHLRVVSTNKARSVLFDGDAFPELPSPPGGVWTIRRVEFAGGGDLLIVLGHFGGRGTWRTYDAIAILETKTWKRHWFTDSSLITAVAVSHDGKRLALVRSTRWSSDLEIGLFRASSPDAGTGGERPGAGEGR